MNAAILILAIERDYYLDCGNYCKASQLHQIIINGEYDEILFALLETDINFNLRSLN